MSVGVAALQGSDGQSIDLVFAQADAAAYRAKRSGGGRVCIYDNSIDVVVTKREGEGVEVNGEAAESDAADSGAARARAADR